MMALTSCDHGEYKNSISYNLGAINIITSVDDGSVTVNTGTYSFDIDLANQKGYVSSSDLVINNSVMSLNTYSQTYESTGADAYFSNIKGTVGSQELNNALFLDTPWYYYTTNSAGEYTYRIPGVPRIVVARYEIGDAYRVNTFQEDTFFMGKTTTTYGEGATNTTEEIIYRFIIDVEKSTATLLMYNAKFSGSPYEPAKPCVVLPGLDVTFASTGITIEGTDIVPEVIEGNEATPYPDYAFDYIEFNTTNPYYTDGEIKYSVGGKGIGEFTGSYITGSYMN